MAHHRVVQTSGLKMQTIDPDIFVTSFKRYATSSRTSLVMKDSGLSAIMFFRPVTLLTFR